MNPRERLLATYHFNNPDKVPLDPGGPRESTLAIWRQQGLPPDVHWRDYLWEMLGLPPNPKSPVPDLGVNFKMLPAFDEIILEHKNGHLVVQDYSGAIVEISDQYDFSYLRNARDFVTRHWHSFPVKSKRDWEEKMKWRYDAHTPERFPTDFAERCQLLKQRETPCSLTIPGPFWQLRDWIGLEPLCLLMVEEPEFIDELITFWTDFMLEMLKPILANVEMDFIQVNEDMAYKMHSMISPRMIRRWMVPCWQQWAAAMRAANVGVISVDSDGYIGELLPLWQEAGFQNTWPVEVAAGNDIVAYRKQYGHSFAFGGGIDKRALAAGGAVMRAELDRVAPLIAEGGYLPTCDHGVPPDVSWPNFIEYTRYLAQLTGWL
jgi:uroporphyrinogen decarboxylase